jgi:ketohexokinase
MSHILTVGIATLDIINVVDHYPQEDEEMRATEQRIARGGNAANTATVLARLGHRVDFAGVIADEPDGHRIEADLANHGVSTRYCRRVEGGKSPTSYICLNAQNGSRTIVHYRHLPELDYAHFAEIPFEACDWLHFEGRNPAETGRMLKSARKRLADQPVSLEIEKHREGIEALVPHADVLLFSRAFVRGAGFETAADFFTAWHDKAPQALWVCSWGEDGAYAQDRAGQRFHSPAFPPPQVIDTIGAGDTFNAGLIAALAAGRTLEAALTAACRLAGHKVGQHGFTGLDINHLEA